MKGLNLREFKKVSGDENHTVMQSPKGHQIKVLHKPLAKAHVDALKALPVAKMAEGGEPISQPSGIPGGGGSPAVDKNKAKDVEQSSQESGWQPKQWVKNVKEGLGFAKGGAVQKFADGGETAEAVADTPEQIAADAQAAPIRPEYQQFLAQEQAKSNPQLDAITGGAEGRAKDDLAQVDSDSAGKADYAAQQARILAGVNEKRSSEGQPPLASLTPQPSAAPTSAPPSAAKVPATGAQQAAPAAVSDPYGDAASLEGGLLQRGIGEQKAGLNAQATAEANLGQQQAKIQQDNASHLQEAMGKYQQRLDQLDQEHANYLKDLQDGHIDPNYMINSMSTGQKALTGIGLLLGGFGQGLMHGSSNQALDFLNKQIDRDIESQKADLGKKENLLSVNMRQYGNIHDAMEATRVQLQAATSAKLGQAASEATGPLAQARATQAAGALDSESAARFGALRMRQGLGAALNSGSQSGQDNTPAKIQMLRLMGHEDLAKNLESRYVPGVGIAGVPVPQGTRDAIVAKQTFGKMAQDFYDWSKAHSGSLDPRTIAEGKTKAAEIQSLYRNSINGGVFKKGEQEFIDNIVDSDPTKFFNSFRVLPKLKEVIRSNNVQQGLLHKSVQLPAPEAPAAEAQFAMKDGVKYQKVSGGWKRVGQ